ncbi:DEAD/DEAH box helicase [Neolewinella antarctica]|uniref:SNF2 family DNA or RNA helicase/uncharacterized Zn finger protein n=1 Tax=Neolewinella antarctica TaxID=442734 RepID=A0ABX0XHR5_9BACT|nr:DEAD/DEAH box helicase [Neolewinella antarctica]NJC28379.1 SNF2 family DNA or RNA helicase/uncharacterized Zn finger protein [Neolewinella antarctica]
MPNWQTQYNPAPAARAGAYRRKYGTTWWGAQFLEALQRADNTGRLARGKTYANKGLVLNIDSAGAGELTAEIQGSMSKPYRIAMNWRPWTKKQAETILGEITGNAALLAQLLAGELPESLLNNLREHGLDIFPRNFRDLNLACSCPDYATPCKHQAALLFVIAADIDGDPFQLFALRGLDLKAALKDLRGGQAKAEVPLLADLLQAVTDPPAYRWDETAYQALHFNVLTDAGWRALAGLPDNPSFDGDGNLTKFLDTLYGKTTRIAEKLYASGRATYAAADLVPPGGKLEVHLDQNLAFDFLASFDGEDEELLRIDGRPMFVDWLQRLESQERHHLDAEARTMLLFFQLARRIAETRAYVPEIFDGGDGDYLLRYVPATNDERARELLERTYALASPTLLYYYSAAEETLEFLPKEAPRALLSLMIGLLVQTAVQNALLSSDAPARKLFLLQNPQQFTLVGTTGFPAAIQRWLSELHLSERAFQPVFRIEEDKDDLLIDILIQDRASRQSTGLADASRSWVPSKFDEWQRSEAGQGANSVEVLTLLGKLTRHFPDLERYLSGGGEKALRYSVPEFTPVLMAALPALEALGLTVMLPTALRKLLRPSLALRADSQGDKDVSELSGIISLDNILQFNWQAALGENDLTEAEFRKLLDSTEGLVKLKEGYAFVDPAEIAKLLDQLEAGPPELKQHERLEAVFTEEYDGEPVRLSPRLRKQINKLREGTITLVPAGINATLRPYQKVGFDWLYSNSQLGFGSIIADDMGLGKTLQVIALLEKYREEGALDKKKALVVVPTSLLGNWRREIERFAPALRAHIYHGSTREIPETSSYDVLLTTYGVLRSEEKTFAGSGWQIMVIDEAQAIKNPSAKQTKAIKKVKAPIKIAMSGTPVENKLLDYWSLLDYTLPKFLGSKTYFKKTYARPIQGERDQVVADRFRRLTEPFVLRRLKSDKSIISDLPDKIVQTETCTLTPEQTAVYQSILDENMRRVEESEGIGRQGLILKLITALKQCCNHPVQFLKAGRPTFAASGKSLLLRERLESILDAGDKVLIFTQYRKMGDLLAEMIEDEFGIKAPFLHGGTSIKQREEMVDRFQNDPACPIFLLSIKAAGTGLNLTAANHVVHYDLWWNPAVENQATDRAYRIGQERTVFVHRLVTENTFEDKIDELISSKRDLADLSVGSGGSFLGRMSDGDLRALVKL